MLSTRFIAFVCASLAALAVVNASPTNSTSVANPETAPSIYACDAWHYTGYCESIAFPDSGCVQLSPYLVRTLSSVKIPDGWACTFYFTNYAGCEYDKAALTTTLIAPGSADLKKQNFNDVGDTFLCTPCKGE
ncbi:hypothetical protein B0H11DRAFT_2110939 [Mycena galericulata]|nr:hypothetical protein B0H11DRAFT_2110939 [Mycena galericulata]